MDADLLLGGSAVAAVVAGTIALLAPCCFSVMLPAYLAGSVQNRRMLLVMTFVFAAGVATIILPLALGAVALRRLLIEGHAYVYVGGGIVVLALAGFTLAGGELRLPLPGRAPGARRGPFGVYTLGAFSGVASSCCAPVLAGVLALAGVTGSAAGAAGLGLAYVFGMVAPLFALALVWDRWGERLGRLFRPRTFTWRAGPLRREVSGSGLASGLLLAAMGAGMVWAGLAGQVMPTGDGWQATLTLALQRTGRAVTDALAWLPGWTGALLVAAGVAWLVRLAWRQRQAALQQPPSGTGAHTGDHHDPAAGPQEAIRADIDA